jgi:hypothetical protein
MIRPSLGAVLVLILLCGSLRADQYDAAVQEQLRLARKEGLPTTAAEFAKRIVPATPSENAAPFYRKLHKHVSRKEDVRRADVAVMFHPDAQTLKVARQLLVKYHDALANVDQAARRPRCWFNRDWDLGVNVLMREYPDMKAAAKLVALRGSIAAAEGNSRAAIEDANKVFIISRHSGQEPHAVARLVGEAIYGIGLSHLAYWAYVHHDQRAYTVALNEAVHGLPRPNLRDENCTDLFYVLSMVDLSMTAKGRKELGLSESDVTVFEKAVPLLANRVRARAEIISAERVYWAALKLPLPRRTKLVRRARSDMLAGLSVFPVALKVYEELGGDTTGDNEAMREQVWVSRKQMYIATDRALQSKRIPQKIRTDDLLSAYDGKSLHYSYNGKQMVFTVSGLKDSSGQRFFKVPPD